MLISSGIKKDLASIDSIDAKGLGRSLAGGFRRVYKAIMLVALLGAAGANQGVLAGEISDSLAPADITSVELRGKSSDRHLSKAIAKSYVEVLARAAIADWPKETTQKIYSTDELKKHYAAANKLVDTIKGDPSIQSLVAAENINFYKSSVDIMLEKEGISTVIGAINTYESAKGRSMTYEESPFAKISEPSTASKAKIFLNLATAASATECSFVATHPSDANSGSMIQSGFYAPLSDKTPQSKSIEFIAAVEHELGHCLAAKIINGLDIESQLNKTIGLPPSSYVDNNGNPLDYDSNNRAWTSKATEAKITTQEVLADSFSVLLNQQNWSLLNAEKIKAGVVPALSPFINKLIVLRSDTKNKEYNANHDTSAALIEIVNQLKKSGQLEKLAGASRGEMLITAYDLAAHNFNKSPVMGGIFGHFSKDYQEAPIKSLFSCGDAPDDGRAISPR